ncbi:MAG: helix-turn-helix domain-containing protein [Acidobacteriaceae bacterium]|nr:helix-turn-helix domain-containing protein [Acidobacteriaceae bacterium]
MTSSPIRLRLKDIRLSRGFSASHLARRVGVTRQTIYAIEDGAFVPNTLVSLKLARTLEVAVEEIFSMQSDETTQPVKAFLLAKQRVNQGRMVRLCRVNNRTIAVPESFPPAYLPLADGFVESHAGASASVKTDAGLPAEGERLLIAGCDPALSLLDSALHGSGTDIVTVPCSSRRALHWLKHGRVHAAGSHLLDRATGDYNVSIIRRLFPNTRLRVVTFATWEQGLIVRHGNPMSIRSVADLAGANLTLINRERGSGSRDLLDSELRRFGIASTQIKGYESTAEGHLAAAHAVAAGNVDCCIAPHSAARCFGLDFIPLVAERFDLAFPQSSLDLPAGKALLDALNRSNLRKSLQCIAGYDTAHTGDVLM